MLRAPAVHCPQHLAEVLPLRGPAVLHARRVIAVEGTLEAADDTGITVAGRTLDYADIERARTVFAWGGAAKGAKRKVASR